MTRDSYGVIIWLFFLGLLPDHFATAQLLSNGTINTVTAVYREAPVDVDGRLTETVWQTTTPASRFVQRDPVEGAPAEEPTEVRVLYDESGLYVGAILYDSNAKAIGNQLVRRDEEGSYDYFELSLD
ncbi:hypothetical protein MJD09_13175, partial [bacterium]|nr:hypothetical protein [bacterium]